ncbi:hypothetical protein GQ600_22872 [Phytophthora cactorum]|nr:hypothetical protein GQ600_22872 [Phytophthora cactorum]
MAPGQAITWSVVMRVTSIFENQELELAENKIKIPVVFVAATFQCQPGSWRKRRTGFGTWVLPVLSHLILPLQDVESNEKISADKASA